MSFSLCGGHNEQRKHNFLPELCGGYSSYRNWLWLKITYAPGLWLRGRKNGFWLKWLKKNENSCRTLFLQEKREREREREREKKERERERKIERERVERHEYIGNMENGAKGE